MSNENSKEREVQNWQKLALLWEFRYLSLHLRAYHKRILLDITLRSSPKLTDEDIAKEFPVPIATSPGDTQINLKDIFGELLFYSLLEECDGKYIQISEKGIEFLRFIHFDNSDK